MAKRNRPPRIVDIRAVRLAGSVVGQIEHGGDADPYTITVANHPAGHWYGMFADISLGDGDDTFLAVQIAATLDRGTGTWKKMAIEEIADELVLSHRLTIWDFGTTILRQVSALCGAVEVEIPDESPEPVLALASNLE